MDEITLGPLTDYEIDKLLCQEDKYFTDDDDCFIKDIAGGSPYLLQVAASVMWEFYEDGKEEDSAKRQQHARQEFYNRTKDTLNHIWQSWSPMTRKTFTYVALAHLKTRQTSLEQQQVDIKPINNLSSFKEELEQLKKQGFVIKDDDKIDGGWRVGPTIFLDFVANQPKQ